MKRRITERQEQIYRMRHHDFGGMSTKQVAAKLGVQPRVIRKHMQNLKRVASQLFPILTKRQAEILSLQFWLSPREIGLRLGVTIMTIYSALRSLRNMGILVSGRKENMKRYSSWMDYKVQQKF